MKAAMIEQVLHWIVIVGLLLLYYRVFSTRTEKGFWRLSSFYALKVTMVMVLCIHIYCALATPGDFTAWDLFSLLLLFPVGLWLQLIHNFNLLGELKAEISKQFRKLHIIKKTKVHAR